jgi:hypothetical protein
MTLLQTPTVSSQAGPLDHWLHALRVSVPPVGLLHVGAGRNNPSAFSTLHSLYAHASQVLALEADASRASQLQATYSALPQVQVRQAVIAGSGGRVSLLRTSVSDESGLCPPEHLLAVWPRLKALRTEDVEALALAECWSAFVPAMSEAGNLAGLAPNWLFVDCLPAAELLQGAPKLLASADVVVARAVQPAMAAGSSVAVPEHLTVAHLQTVLAKQGLHLLGTQEENHPALVLAVFARDQRQQLVQGRARFEQLKSDSAKLAALWDTKQQELASAKLSAAKLAGDRQARIDELVRAREEQSQLATQRQQQIEQLTKAHGEQVHLVAQREQQVEQLTKARDEQFQLAAERERQILQLTKAHEQQAQLTAQRQQQIDQLTKARDEQSQLATQRQQEIDRLTKAHGEQVHLVAQRAQQIEQLTKARDEQAKLVAERDAQLQAAAQAKAQAEKLAQDRAAQIEQLSKARDLQANLAQERETLAGQIAKARDEQAKLAAERQKKIAQLEGELADMNARYALLHEELVKAEAHVELISDLVLRESLR